MTTHSDAITVLLGLFVAVVFLYLAVSERRSRPTDSAALMGGDGTASYGHTSPAAPIDCGAHVAGGFDAGAGGCGSGHGGA